MAAQTSSKNTNNSVVPTSEGWSGIAGFLHLILILDGLSLRFGLLTFQQNFSDILLTKQLLLNVAVTEQMCKIKYTEQ